MKIVHVINCCAPAGAEILAKNILKNIKQIDNDCEIELWSIYRAEVFFNGDSKAIEFERNFINELKNFNINVKFIDKKKNFISRFNVMLKIKQFYKQFKADVIHCHLESVTFHIVTGLMFKKVKIVETVHNIKINKVKVHKFYLNYRINKFVAISERVSETIKNQLTISDDKIKLIYNGIELDKYKKSLEFKENVNSIVAIGRLTRQKDHITLLKAYKILNNICNDNKVSLPELTIVGEGELKEQLEVYIKENRLEKVKLLGVSSNVNEVLKSNQVYIMSSIYEGLSLSLMEAAASGIAIICTDVGSNSEIIKDNINGILVEPSNELQIANSIFKLINEVELRKKFYNNSCKFIDSFDIKECANNHLKFYKEIVRG